MRDSCVRIVRPASDHAVIVLATLTLLTPAAVALEWLTHGAAGAWRAVLAPASALAGISQGAVLVSALMRVSDPRFRPGLRRAAELLGLALPATWVCHLLLVSAGGVFAPGAPLRTPGAAAHLLLAALLAACGTAYVIASLRADGHLPLRDGWLARALDPTRAAPARPFVERRRARALGVGYLLAYVAVSPWLNAHAVSMVRLARPEALPGIHLSLADVFLALAAAVLLEASACARDPDDEVLSETDLSAAAGPLLAMAAILGLALGADVLARKYLGGAGLGILPPPAGGERIPALATFGTLLGDAIPVCLLARRRARTDALTVSLAAGLALLGAVMERGAVLTPVLAPVHSLAEAGAVVGLGAVAGLFVQWALRAVGFEGATRGVVRRPSIASVMP